MLPSLFTALENAVQIQWMHPAQEGGRAKPTEHCKPMGTREQIILGLRLATVSYCSSKAREMFSSYSWEHWGQRWHILSWQNWDRSVYCHPQIHRPPTLPKTNKGTPPALGQTWTWAGQTLLQCLENCQFVILIFPMSLVCYGSYVKINIKKINWLLTLKELKWAKAGNNFGRPSNNSRECG